MGFPVHTFPSTTFDAVEASLRSGGFRVESSGTPEKKRLLARDGIARAKIDDYTEEEDSEVHFVVLSARGGLFSALAFWPIDFWLARRVERHLRSAGARHVNFRDEKEA